MIHRHYPGRHTYRLVYARMLFDRQAEQIVAHQVGDCAHCWRDIALSLAGHVAAESDCGTLTMAPSGLIEGQAITWVMTMITTRWTPPTATPPRRRRRGPR